jgi:glycosyltransferase involved in cell wall biosynthesis
MGVIAPTLSVVVPVHDEEAVIDDVVVAIVREVLDTVPASELVIVDDASNDSTPFVLAAHADADPRITVLRNDVNRGHGPSLRRAIDASSGAWILHLDSDGQVDPSELARLWDRRHEADLVLGVRRARHDPRHRVVLTTFTRALVSALAGRRIHDANSPFKLIRRPLMDHLAPHVPEDAFAPSILIVLGAARAGARIVEIDVTHLARPHGRSSLRLGGLGRAVARSTIQAVRLRRQSISSFGRPG